MTEETSKNSLVNGESAENYKKKLLAELENASPLDTFSLLEQVEVCDARNAQDIIEEVHREFETGEQRVETIVIPVFTSIVDGLVKDSRVGQMMRQGGLSATRIVTECRSFTYGKQDPNVYSEVEKNRIIAENAEAKAWGDINDGETFAKEVNQQYYRVKETAEKYGDKYFDFGFRPHERLRTLNRNRQQYGGKLMDEYREKPLYESRKAAAAAEGHTKYSPEVDHIVPLEKLHAQMKDNCMLSNEDLRNIANIDDNLAITSQEINRSKQGSTNQEYVQHNGKDLDEATKQRMVEKAENAQRAVDSKANKTVLNNMLDEQHRDKLAGELGKTANAAAADGAKMGIGNVLVAVLKPVYYEVADSFSHGFVSGVGADSIKDAIKIRAKRVKDYVCESLAGVMETSFWDIVKNVVSGIISAIVDLFFGIVKDMLNLIRKGFPVAVSAIKILADPQKSIAEKGDAVVKLLGGTVISILGGTLVKKIAGGNELLEAILNCLVSGCGSLMFMALLDKLDLFHVKAERRKARIREIFEARLAEMQERVSCLQVDALNLLSKQRICFEELIQNASKAIEEKNPEKMVGCSYAIAAFFSVELEFSNTREFVEWWDKQKVLCF